MQTINNTRMKAAYVNAYDSLEAFEIKELAKPTPSANEILVKVVASSVTRADVMMLSGKPYFTRLFVGLTKPKNPIPGTGFSGVIEAVGADVKGFEIGDAVFGETTLGFNANAEYLTIAQDGVLLKKPSNLSHEMAAGFCDGYITSYNFLKELADIQTGQEVLINGASGSLGTAAVQLAKRFGAKVTAVCSAKNASLVRNLGADEVIDYAQSDFTKGNKKYDIIYDTVGKSDYCSCRAVLKEKGQYLSPVMAMGLIVQSMWTDKFAAKKAKFAATGLRKAEELREFLNALLTMHEAKPFHETIDKVFKLEDIAAAHAHVKSGHKVGNVVLKVA